MAKKKKLIRFKENSDFEELFEPNALDLLKQDHENKGKWAKNYFGNSNSITLELGCGRGEYTVGLAALYPDRNFIGVDVKGSRINFGIKALREAKLKNACFVRSQIEMLNYIFKNEIGEIWLTFPDPSPDKVRRRLTAPIFLTRYSELVLPNTPICLKTDSHELYTYTKWVVNNSNLEILSDTDDLYNSPLCLELPQIQSEYEKKYLAQDKKICFLKFSLK